MKLDEVLGKFCTWEIFFLLYVLCYLDSQKSFSTEYETNYLRVDHKEKDYLQITADNDTVAKSEFEDSWMLTREAIE